MEEEVIACWEDDDRCVMKRKRESGTVSDLEVEDLKANQAESPFKHSSANSAVKKSRLSLRQELKTGHSASL